MRRTGRLFLLGAGLLAVALAARADSEPFELTQTVEQTQLAVGEPFEVTVTATGAPDSAQIELPTPQDFEVVSTYRSSQMSYQVTSSGAGVVQRTRKWVITMRPLRPGRFTIAGARMVVGRRTVEAEPVRVVVQRGAQGGGSASRSRRSGSNPFGFLFQNPFGSQGPFGSLDPFEDSPRTDSDLFVREELDRKEAFVGQQVNLSLYIYSRVDLSSVEALDMPRLDGFWSEDVESPTQLSPEHKMVGGLAYRRYLLRRRALFPVRPGTIRIDPAQADVAVGFVGSRAQRKSNATTLTVKPLPPGAPPGFVEGNVGRWRLSSELASTQVELGQPVTVKVVAEGTGSLKNLTIPKLAPPSAFKLYDPTTTDTTRVEDGRLGGKRVQEYLLMPQQTGTFALPPLSLPYFDPEAGRYEIARSPGLTLTIVSGRGSPSAAQPSPERPEGEKNVLAGGGIKGLRPVLRSGPSAEDGRTVELLLFGGPPGFWLLVVGLGWVQQALDRRDSPGHPKAKARAARRHLRSAQRLGRLGEQQQSIAQAHRAVVEHVEGKVGHPVGGMTLTEIEQAAKAAGASAGLASEIRSFLEACEAARYAPIDAIHPDRAFLGRARAILEGW